uniref:Uncharacterized protein n=1 Tax=Picea sitchensis TaxID=3332 RepID=A9P144_PICSI|nr:unknown [Picea sitchensis]
MRDFLLFARLKISNYPLVHIKAKMMTLWRFVEYATVKNLTKKEKLLLSFWESPPLQETGHRDSM